MFHFLGDEKVVDKDKAFWIATTTALVAFIFGLFAQGYIDTSRFDHLSTRIDTMTVALSEADAENYQALLSKVSATLAKDGIAESQAAADEARLADWMVRQDKIFPWKDSPTAEKIQVAIKEFADAQQKLTSQVRHTSRAAMAMLDGSGEDEPLLIRGSYRNPGKLVPRRFLEAISKPDSSPTPSGWHPDRGRSLFSTSAHHRPPPRGEVSRTPRRHEPGPVMAAARQDDRSEGSPRPGLRLVHRRL